MIGNMIKEANGHSKNIPWVFFDVHQGILNMLPVMHLLILFKYIILKALIFRMILFDVFLWNFKLNKSGCFAM